MKRDFPLSFEFIFSLFALILAFFIVEGIYIGYVRPNARAMLDGQRVAQKLKDGAALDANMAPKALAFLGEREIKDILASETKMPDAEQVERASDFIEERSLPVTIKDFEQQACFILFLWAMAMILYKSWDTLGEKGLLNRDIVSITEGMRIGQGEAADLRREVQALSPRVRKKLVPRAMTAALHRFVSTGNVQDVADASHAVCAAEGDRMDSELSMIRYIAWAIPSVGFIGTVRGIGTALAKSASAMEDGQLSLVTGPLGTAFNSTFIALILSIILMFFVHQLQLMQERLALEAENYCNDSLIRHLYVPPKG